MICTFVEDEWEETLEVSEVPKLFTKDPFLHIKKNISLGIVANLDLKKQNDTEGNEGKNEEGNDEKGEMEAEEDLVEEVEEEVVEE